MSEQGPTVFNDRYELHRKLARGGMSDVYLARDQLLDRPVAVKVLFPEYARDATFVERFRREAQSVANLSHGNIVAVYDWGEQAGTYFIVMEYVEGRSLSEIIRTEGPLHPTRAAEIAADVASALSFAHRNGVVHRDVKPGNVLIGPSGQVKVTDFGIAQAISGNQSHLTQDGSVMGTAAYFSPEQAQGKPVDPRSDLYSLGCVLYEMLTTRPPFEGDTPVAIAYKHVQELPTAPSALGVTVPPALEAITLRLLAKDPAQRYPSADDLRSDLRRFLEGEPVSTPPTIAATAPPPVAPTAGVPAYYDEPVGSRRTGWWVALMILLLGGLAAALIYVASNLDSTSAKLITVPNVIEETQENAIAELQKLGFDVEVVTQPRDDKPEKVVFDQDPKGNTQAEPGSTVTIYVSAGQDQVEVPDVTDLTESNAEAKLRQAGFEVQIRYAKDDQVDEDRVIKQSPEGGKKADKGSVVTITVSQGKDLVEVPDVRGQNAATAANQLRQAGFNVAEQRRNDDVVAAGVVIDTQPGAGTEVEPDATITLIVSNGPAATTTTAPPSTTTTTAPTTTTTTAPTTSSTAPTTSSTKP